MTIANGRGGVLMASRAVVPPIASGAFHCQASLEDDAQSSQVVCFTTLPLQESHHMEDAVPAKVKHLVALKCHGRFFVPIWFPATDVLIAFAFRCRLSLMAGGTYSPSLWSRRVGGGPRAGFPRYAIVGQQGEPPHSLIVISVPMASLPN